MKNGLSVTVPASWEARLQSTTPTSGALSDILGSGVGASESLSMTRVDGAAPIGQIEIDSYPRAEDRDKAIAGWPVVLASKNVTVSVESTDPTMARILAVQTALPGAQFGIAFFGASGRNYQAQLERVFKFLKFKGVSVP